MLKMLIKNSQGEVTNGNMQPTLEELDAWYEFNKDYFPQPHTKHVISAAEEVQERMRDQESDEAIDLGAVLVKKIRKINRRKIRTGVWTETQFNALLLNPLASKVERALWNGSFSTAKYLITQMSEFYSDIEIADVISRIDAHELKWVELV